MRSISTILLLAIGLSWLGCGKSVDDPVNPTDSLVTVPVPVVVKKQIGVDYFLPFTSQGPSHTYQRVDFLHCDPSQSVFTNPAGLSWTKGRKPSDTIFYYNSAGQKIDFTLIYRDTTQETFSITGNIALGNLIAGYTSSDGDISPLRYLRDSLQLPDATLLSVIRIRNDNWQTDDTVYAFASAVYVLFMPTPFRNRGVEGFSYAGKLPLDEKRDNQDNYRVRDSSFVYGGKTYTPAAYTFSSGSSGSANGQISFSSGKGLVLSKKYGLLQYYRQYGKGDPLSFFSWRVWHSFIN